MTRYNPATTAKNGPSRPRPSSRASKARAPHSVLPKALRRGGKRPLQLVWPAKPHRVHVQRSKREWAALQRRAHQIAGERARRAKKRARKGAAA